jgi:hypothetical protein
MTSPVRAPRPTPRRIAPEPAPRRSHLRVVPPPARGLRGRPSIRPVVRRRRTGAVLAVALVVVFGSLMASAVFHGLLVGGQANLDHLDTELQEKQGELAREKLVLADLQSPARIAAEARSNGMIPAETQTWVSPVEGSEPIVTGGAEDDPTDPTDTTDPTTDPAGTTEQTGTELATADGGGPAQ